MKKTENRGGRRPGAGRKPKSPLGKGQFVRYYLPPDQAAVVREFVLLLRLTAGDTRVIINLRKQIAAAYQRAGVAPPDQRSQLCYENVSSDKGHLIQPPTIMGAIYFENLYAHDFYCESGSAMLYYHQYEILCLIGERQNQPFADCPTGKPKKGGQRYLKR